MSETEIQQLERKHHELELKLCPIERGLLGHPVSPEWRTELGWPCPAAWLVPSIHHLRDTPRISPAGVVPMLLGRWLLLVLLLSLLLLLQVWLCLLLPLLMGPLLPRLLPVVLLEVLMLLLPFWLMPLPLGMLCLLVPLWLSPLPLRVQGLL